MQPITQQYLDQYKEDDYVWYACYGSNINTKRFLLYIKGDISKQFSTHHGCKDKSLPKDSRQYIFNCPIYFAGESKIWGGGVAFLDYQSQGKCYGKIYKIKKNQFIDILKQEQRNPNYNTMLLVDIIDDMPVITFTAKEKLVDILNQPSEKYIECIEIGIYDLYPDLTSDQVRPLLSNNKM